MMGAPGPRVDERSHLPLPHNPLERCVTQPSVVVLRRLRASLHLAPSLLPLLACIPVVFGVAVFFDSVSDIQTVVCRDQKRLRSCSVAVTRSRSGTILDPLRAGRVDK